MIKIEFFYYFRQGNMWDCLELMVYLVCNAPSGKYINSETSFTFFIMCDFFPEKLMHILMNKFKFYKC